jgi:mono/diheme cytochrome c family protein
MTPSTHRAEHAPLPRCQPMRFDARQPPYPPRRRARRARFAAWTCLGSAAGALLLAGCSPDLGECDMAMLGGSATGTLAPHTGQQLLRDSCAAGLCHAESAKGEFRKGAPAGLNFDIVPASTSEADVAIARRSSGVVSNYSEEIWEQVEAGTMPPPKPAGAGPLAPSRKEILRNWLACGAPVVEAPATADPNADAWTKIYVQLSGSCTGCHAPTAAASTGGGFVLGEASMEAAAICTAYHNVVGVATSASGACSGKRIVTASEPDNSVLLVKLVGSPNLCGALMPLGTAMPFAMTHAELVADLRTWIMSGAPAPAGCK